MLYPLLSKTFYLPYMPSLTKIQPSLFLQGTSTPYLGLSQAVPLPTLREGGTLPVHLWLAAALLIQSIFGPVCALTCAAFLVSCAHCLALPCPTYLGLTVVVWPCCLHFPPQEQTGMACLLLLSSLFCLPCSVRQMELLCLLLKSRRRRRRGWRTLSLFSKPSVPMLCFEIHYSL